MGYDFGGAGWSGDKLCHIHNWCIQDLIWLQNYEEPEVLMLKLQHLCCWFHKEIVQDFESEVHA